MLGPLRQAVSTAILRSARIPRVSRQLTAAKYSSDVKREPYPLSRFPHPKSKDDLEPDIRQRMEEMEEASGFMPNVFTALAHRPAEFRAFFSYYDALMDKETGSLTKAEKEMIVVATSAHNNCHYCVVAHSALHRIYSKDQYKADQIAISPESAHLTDREKAIVNFAMKVCKSEAILDSDLAELEAQGLSREDQWDVGAIAAFFALSNRMAHLTAMRPNEEFYLIGRVPKPKM